VLLGKYKVERVLGVGGMGVVVAAQHIALDERVAIKFLLPEMLQHPDIVQRFVREARSAIKIRSEHCVRILDVGALDTGAPYMVMEYLEGNDLGKIVEQNGAMAIADAVDFVLQAGEALAEAHALGIVHRDLKPANLFLARRADGTPCVKVLDFGISKQAASGADAGMTKTSAILGSPRYMSPEQMRSTKDVDARADVWALGAVIHELSAGTPPFDAETMTALCAAIVQDAPNSLRAARPDAPPGLEAATLGALEKDRSRRYQNVAEFAAALAPFGSSSAQASATRIARVLGVSGEAVRQRLASITEGVLTAASGPGVATTTSGAVGVATAGTTQGLRKLPAMALAVAGIGAVSLVVILLVVLGRHPAPSSSAAESHPSAAASTLQAAVPPSPAVAPPPPSAFAATSASAAPGAETPTISAEPNARPAASATGRKATTPRPASPGAPAAKPPASPSNPFGDDRKG
jgi:serine/threonine-protein kinase